MDSDNLGGCRGILFGLLFSIPLWAVIIFVIYALVARG